MKLRASQHPDSFFISSSSPSSYSESAARHLSYIWHDTMKGEKTVMQDAQQQSDTRVVLPPTYHDDRDALDEVALPKPVRRGKRRLISISVLLVLVIAAGVVFYVFRSSSATLTYQTMPVTQGNLVLTATATGSVQANTYNADFSTSGTLAAIYVHVGQQVHTGQKLAQLSTTALQDALKVAQTQLQQTEDFGTWDAIQIAQAQVDQAQHNLDAATLTAPHSGVITAINGSIGSTPGGGSSGSASGGFIAITDMSALNVLLSVNEADIGHVARGDLVRFTVDAYGNRTFRGQVASITQSGQTSNNIVTYPVSMSVDSSSLQGANLIPGMTANATITTMTRQNVLLIRNSAVSFAQGAVTQGLIQLNEVQSALVSAHNTLSSLFRSQGVSLWQDNPNASFVLEQRNGQLTAVPVILGLSDGSSYEVLSGLNANDTIVVGANSSGNSGSPSGSQQQAQPVNSGSKG
jgi:multidrug efflux pump subunit AcrA (membrane-fusion protein)